MGDYNTIVVEESTDKIVGPFGHGKRNEKGKILINYWKQRNLVVMNTWKKVGKKKHMEVSRRQEIQQNLLHFF